MSLHQKQYREPEALSKEAQMLTYIRILREALEHTINDYVAHGSMSYPRPETQQLAFRALEATEGLY